MTIWQDIRYGIRMLNKSPGFTAIALITLAIGIGANTIMFSVVNVLLLRPPHVKDPDRLVVCNLRNVHGSIRYSTYIEIRDNNLAFSDVMACDPYPDILTVMRGGTAGRISAAFVSANYFSGLGVTPTYGRGFLPQEERYGAEPVVVLSHRTWRRYGGNPNIVGTYLSINGTLFRVIGIAPKGFTGTGILGPDIWLPLGSYGLVGHLGEDKWEKLADEFWNYSTNIALVGRLKPGLTMAEAQVRLQLLVSRLKTNHPKWWTNIGRLDLDHMSRLIVSNGLGTAIQEKIYLYCVSLFLMAISAMVLLITCLNLANMVMVRGTSRHREIAVRMAVGGGRWRIVRQLLIESVLLAIFGGALGLVFAFWGVRILNTWMGSLKNPLWVDSLRTGLDVRVLAATLVFCMVAAILSGLKPAWRLSRRDVAADLKESRGEAFLSAGRVPRPRGFSVVLQIALSVVLVMGAALFTRSALQARPGNLGFSFDSKLLIELDPLAAGYDLARSQQVYEILADRFRSMPGVQAAGLSMSFPFCSGSGQYSKAIVEYVPGTEKDQRDEEQVLRDAMSNPPTSSDTVYNIGVDYFNAMGIALLQGRPLNHLDGAAGAEKVFIIDEQIAHRLRPDGRALGCLVQYGWPFPSEPCRVIGIVPHVRTVSYEKNSRGQAYVPMRSDRPPTFLHLRLASTTRGTEVTLLEQIPKEIRKLDPHLPILSMTTLEDCYANNPTVWAAGMGARLAITFGIMALFLASLGIYAVKGYMVASRTPEIGIRKALGATHVSIMGMILREGIVLTLVGLIVGLFLTLAVGHLIGSLLYGVKPVDPASIFVTVILLGAASLLASYIPARRAAKIDPMEALRYE